MTANVTSKRSPEKRLNGQLVFTIYKKSNVSYVLPRSISHRTISISLLRPLFSDGTIWVVFKLII
jgi:hypothetical protein